MANLETTYLGLKIKNPIIVSSSGLTSDINRILLCEEAGAGAVVLQSIFEEHIRSDYEGEGKKEFYGMRHPEAYQYFHSDSSVHYGASAYRKKIEEARKRASIPIIASINCYSTSYWVSFAKATESAGAQALELNISFPPVTQMMDDPTGHLLEIADVVKKVTDSISIPVSIKLPPSEIFIGSMAKTFVDAGAKGLVLFNRFMVPRINLDTMEVVDDINFSISADSASPRRFIALLAKRLECEFTGAGGVHTAEDLLGLICVGAQAVQMASALYINGLNEIQKLLDEISSWMDEHYFKTIDEFRGYIATDPNKRENPFGRFQYIRMMDELVPTVKPKSS